MELFKKTFVFIIFLIPIFAFPQNDLIINEKSQVNFEKLDVIFHPNPVTFLGEPVTFLGKNAKRINVGNYGEAKVSRKGGSSGSTEVLGLTFNREKDKFSIDFNNTLNESSKLKLTKTNRNGAETLTAAITTNLENSKPWDFIFKNNTGWLTEGERTIKVIQRYVSRPKNINEKSLAITPERLIYEFIENGISLGAVTFDDENSIWLRPDLDSTTKLVLCTTMLSIANY